MIHNFKKYLTTFILCAGLGTCAVQANAEGWRHGGGHYVYRDGMGWVVPAVVGGLIVYGATRPAPPPTTVIVQQPAPVIYPAPQVVPPPAPAGYHWEAILDSNCNCYRTVLIPN